MMILAIIVIILLLLCGYLLFVLFDVKRVISQLNVIIQDSTNQELNLHSRNFLVKDLAHKVNLLLNKHQKSEQQLYQLKGEQDVAIHNIAHDLRTPLTVASGYTQVLLKNTTIQNDDRQSLERIEQNLNNVAKHLDLLLMYNRLNEHKLALNFQKINVTNFLQEMILGMYEALTSKKIELKLNLQSNCWWVVDHDAFQRILQNILGNILEHGTATATITLKSDDQRLWLKFENSLAQPIRNPDRLTNRFYTEDLARKSENAGLGLYITEKLAKLMNGTMTIQTKKTNFTIELAFIKKNL
ncbi:hypothetical protein AYR54_07475 [Loigolactobacillus backii]|uniref:histidine kinase n=1 Tax=Loigolactobacillus backii TaxID=375175 RepID=A0A192H253_9LACO|nr:HAMP domain-containing sensor histidine kinase [Loigolactobacillus backii]ANK60199.1 hypothetical protein AYR52_08065 [Loigolactobacillus backii]ANK62358.1 hypothetical protein AYR53_05920 [Loigolactobacillus backii]ANK65081.1 hypothetical protein AYR54_07475 [Loigolactobacillus backii]ANK67640.1 hypothetical protein AYR55_08080 [Loigolactobacillus backii]ANK70630.1 hypothetical protein AYR56_11070 [Loigolactobacillus backii]